jgi:hypothetical protein
MHPGLFLLFLLRGRVLLGPRRREPLLLAQPVLLVPPLATLAVSLRALLLARHPLPLPLLQRPTERARAGSGRIRLRGTQAHQL